MALGAKHVRWGAFLLLGLCVLLGDAMLDARDLVAQHYSTQTGSDATLVAGFVGTWKAPVERTERTGSLNEEVFGPGSFDVRNVNLTIQPSGEGDLRVSTSVVDRKGRTHVPSVVEVKLRIGGPQTAAPAGTRPTITILSAEERFLDGAGERFPLDGVRVTMTLPSPTSRTLEFSLDTKEGRGSFGATLERQSLVKTSIRSRQGQRQGVGDQH